MPTYEYECRNCEHALEKEQRHDAKPLKMCPKCGKMKLFRVISGGVYSFVYGTPTTVGHLAERNSKAMGSSAVQRLEDDHKERGIRAKQQALDEMKAAGKIPEGASLPDEKKKDNWYGSLPDNKKKDFDTSSGKDLEKKITKYIKEGRMSDSRAPHMAVMNVMVEVHEVLDTGECSGRLVTQEELDRFDIKSFFLMSVKGYNRDDCLQKLKNKIRDFDNE